MVLLALFDSCDFGRKSDEEINLPFEVLAVLTNLPHLLD
jgi:hypothetical protein